MTTSVEDLIRDFAERCREKMHDFDKAEVKCGIIGPSGSGKSSLINAIAGEKIAPTGVVETTNEPQQFSHKGLIFVDLPGCGTKKWPKESYIERLGLLTYDCFLLVTADRFTENDIFLFRELSSRGKPCFVIRNKFDRAVQEGLRDNGLEEEDIRRQIEENIRENLAPPVVAPAGDAGSKLVAAAEVKLRQIEENLREKMALSFPEHIYLTSAWHPTKFDLRKLLNHITDALQGLKRNRFIADMAVYSEETLKKKREVAMGLIPVYAGLSALNGLNPIPGVDITADVALLIKLAQEVVHIYGLSSKQLEFIKRMLGPDKLPSLIAKIAQFTAKYMAKEGVIQLLKRIATRVTAKEVSKWIPFVGPLIAAGIGWQATFMLGEDLVNEAEKLAREILDAIIKGSDLPDTDSD